MLTRLLTRATHGSSRL